MAKNLIIVESPAKAKTIERYLGRDYKVAASMGHVRDLPKSKLGVDVEDGFEPQYITIRGKGKVLKKLRKEAKSSEAVFLATDPDREGEAIAWHLIHALKLEEDDQLRVAFNEITKNAIRRAFEQPRSIDVDLVNSQQARRILDRLVGYKLSPFLWRKVRRGLSAGRVQSAAVRMVVDRERKREAFEPEEYWTLDADFLSSADGGQPDEQFTARLQKWRGDEVSISSEKQMNRLLENLPRSGYAVAEVKREEKKRYPSAAFTTSSLQQMAARRLGMKASFAMRIAQQLYEGVSVGDDSERRGLITYMRTDSTRVSSQAVGMAKEFVQERYGEHFSQPRTRRGRARQGAEEAHEAIRPTDVGKTPQMLKSDLSNPQYRLYRLIWQRFVASQMKPAVYDETTVTISSGGAQFSARGKVMKFPGFRILYGTNQSDSDDDLLPEMSEGDRVQLKELLPKQNFTQPPARFTEASLVRAMEEEGIGRPSTYAPIIETIQKRGYVGTEDNRFYPTELGRAVNSLLEDYFPDVVDLSFTADMENKLDEIEEGDVDWLEVISEFWEPFSEELDTAYKKAERVQLPVQETDIECEECGRTMVIKHGRYGKFIACPGYPECENTMPYFEKTGAQCPDCGGDIVKRRSKKGRTFYGCSNWPDCEFVVWNEPSGQKCPDCGAFMVKKRSKKKGNYLQCSRGECQTEVLPGEQLEAVGEGE